MIPNDPKQNEDAAQKGTTEDPPVNLTKQNQQGNDGSTATAVPKEALENYRQSGREGEE